MITTFIPPPETVDTSMLKVPRATRPRATAMRNQSTISVRHPPQWSKIYALREVQGTEVKAAPFQVLDRFES